MPASKFGMGTLIEFDYRLNIIKPPNFMLKSLMISESENQLRKTFDTVHKKYYTNLVLETFRQASEREYKKYNKGISKKI